MIDEVNMFNSITIKIASPETIRSWSKGEVKKPETINYRTLKPEKDGLFCERIFGPVKDYECHCGKYKRIRYKGITCDRCGVEVSQKSVRRERMGHIALAVPVVHIWYFRSLPSKIGYVLGLSSKELEKIIYYESYVVINPGTTGIQKQDLITEDQFLEILASLPENNSDLEDSDPKKFIAKMGGEAIRDLLRRVNVEELAVELRTEVKTQTSVQKKTRCSSARRAQRPSGSCRSRVAAIQEEKQATRHQGKEGKTTMALPSLFQPIRVLTLRRPSKGFFPRQSGING